MKNVLDLIITASENGVKVFLEENKLKVIVHHKNKKQVQILNELKENKNFIIKFLENQKNITSSNKNYNSTIVSIPNKEDIKIPLSFSQERLWMIDKMVGSPNYHISINLRIKGELQVNVLERAIAAVVERHEILRTVYLEDENGRVFQKPLPTSNFKLTTINLPFNEALKEFIFRENNKAFNLSREIPIRALIFPIEQEHVLSITTHHIATDGLSEDIFIQELLTFYKSFSKNSNYKIPFKNIQYSDYAIWQRNTYDDEFSKQTLNFWKKQLNGYKYLDFPLDYPRGSIQSINGELCSYNIDRKLKNKVERFFKENNTTLFTFMFSVFKILLFKYTGEEDICIGTPVTNRENEETQDLIGYFANTLPIRTKLDGILSFIQIIEKINSGIVLALKNKEIPFEKIVDAIVKKRDLSRNPIFQTMFSVQNNIVAKQSEEGTFNDVIINLEPSKNFFTKFDLTFNVANDSDNMTINIQYCSDLFEKETIERIGKYFLHLIDLLIKNPNKSIDNLDIVTDSDWHKLNFFNNTDFENISGQENETILDHFERQVRLNPNKVAVATEKEQLTYSELKKKVNNLAQYLRQSQYIQPDDIIGIMLERSPLMIISILGVLKSGAAYVPIDLHYPLDRKIFMIDNSKMKSLIIASKNLSDEILDIGVSVFIIDTKLDFLPDAAENKDLKLSNSRDLAYVIYTSGTSGKPKGVMIEHQSLLNLCFFHKEFYKVDSASRVALYHGPAFDGSVWELFPYLMAGASVYPIESDDVRFDMLQLAAFIKNNKITHIHLPTQIVLSLIDQKIELKNTVIMTGGEALVVPPNNLLNIYNNYGPTEGTVVSTIYKVGPRDLGNVPIGKPISNVSAYILNKKGQMLPPGSIGELYIGGKGVARGYIGKPKLTKETFVEDRFLNIESKMYKTGDLARLRNDGNIEFKGRVDRQIKIRGYRIELSEIESVLMKIETVSNAFVIDKIEDENKYLVAYVVVDGDFNEKNILRYLASAIPKYMIPNFIVQIDSLPLNENGKLDLNQLPNVKNKKSLRENYIAPRNELEKSITEIWEQLLNVRNIGVNEDFFELGGYSLLIIKMVPLIKDKLKENISVKDIFNFSTVAKLADFIVNKKSLLDSLNEVIDLKSESEVDIDFSIIPVLDKFDLNPKAILLIGATGFIGAYILKELLINTNAIIYCLVREKEGISIKKRVTDNLKYYNIYNTFFENRIIAIKGDLSKVRLGIEEEEYNNLSSKVDFVYNSGTFMDHHSSYNKLKSTNVAGCVEILKFSVKNKLKKVIHLSTLGMFIPPYHENQFFEWNSREFEIHRKLNGYGASKWISDIIMKTSMEKGMPIQIYRIGLTTGDLKSGKMPKSQWYPKLLKSCYELGAYTSEYLAPIIPVDFIGEAITKLSLKDHIEHNIFHLNNNRLVSLKRIFENAFGLDKKIENLTFQDILLKALEYSDKLHLPILSFVDFNDPEIRSAMQGNHPVREDDIEDDMKYNSNELTMRILKKEVGLDFPNINEHVKKYVMSAVKEYK